MNQVLAQEGFFCFLRVNNDCSSLKVNSKCQNLLENGIVRRNRLSKLTARSGLDSSDTPTFAHLSRSQRLRRLRHTNFCPFKPLAAA